MMQLHGIFGGIASGLTVLALSACAPQVPDSAQGVGFNNYDAYQQQRDAVLEGRSQPTTIGAPPAVTGAPLSALTRDEQARIEARNANSGVDPLEASPRNPAPELVQNSVGISGENDFDAVANTRSIEGDAALIAQNRARYQVIQPEALPTRPGTDSPNIVAYALQTTNPKGAPIYRRSSFASEARHLRACAAFTSSDLAQEAFLAAGGPEKDREHLDPDGDGFACDWDPAPFRAVRN